MKKAQIARKKKPAISVTIPRRQNFLEKEIPFSYLAEEKGNQSTIQYQKYANPVHRALYN
jgi:hypothetical protein